MKLSTKVMGSAVGALTALVASEAMAESLAVSDFQRLCIETRADPAAAFAAADASGWTRDGGQSINFVGLSGNPDGRVINAGTTDFRAFTAGQSSSDRRTRRKCVVVAQGSFDAVAEEMIRIMPTQVGPRTASQMTWNYGYVDGVALSLDHGSTHDAVNIARSNSPMIEVTALRVEGGAVLAYSATSYEQQTGAE